MNPYDAWEPWREVDIRHLPGSDSILMSDEAAERLNDLPVARPVVGFTNAPVKPTYSPRHRK